MSWSKRKELTVTVIVQKLDEEDYVALAQVARAKDRFRATDPGDAYRIASEWATKEVRKDDPKE